MGALLIAHGLTILRLALVVPFLVTCRTTLTAGPGLWPLVIFGIAAATDFADGRIARRTGTASPAGELLDSTADILFVESALICFASWGRLSWVVPVAVAGAVAGYVRDSWRRRRSERGASLDRTRIGRSAGIWNYVLVGFLAGELMFPTTAVKWVIDVVVLVTIGLNALALVGRLSAPAISYRS